MNAALPPGAAGEGRLEDRIYAAIFDSVMAQRLRPGTRLSEAELCRLFGARRASVRKVLQRLAHDHIVDLVPNKGASVAVPTPAQTREIFEARRGVEAAIVGLACARADAVALAALREQLAAEHAMLHGADQPAWVRLASGFHLKLAALAGNAVLTGYLIELISRCALVLSLYERPGDTACEHDEHTRIVDLIAAGDADGARREMEAHLRELESRIRLEPEDDAQSLARMLGLG